MYLYTPYTTKTTDVVWLAILEAYAHLQFILGIYLVPSFEKNIAYRGKECGRWGRENKEAK